MSEKYYKMKEDPDKIPDERTGPLIEATSQLLNPFVHRLELNSAYDRFKVSTFQIFL